MSAKKTNLDPWLIWCGVSGGITGTRAGFARDGDKYVTFDSKEAAERCADKWRESTAGSLSTARHTYTVIQMSASLSSDVAVRR